MVWRALAFADLLGTELLFVTLDRINMKPPGGKALPLTAMSAFEFLHADALKRRAPPRPVRLSLQLPSGVDGGGAELCDV